MYVLPITGFQGFDICRNIADSEPRGCTGDEGLAPRSRFAGAGAKTPEGALVKSWGDER